MMHRMDRWVAALLTPALCLGLAAQSRAELIDRGTFGGVTLIYDSTQRITWLGDANWAQTSGADSDGAMTWAEARAWAADLTIGPYSDWRLPLTSDETCNGTGCTNSEMGHLFGVDGISSATPGAFTNLRPRQYWSSRSDTSDPDAGWHWHFGTGDQGATSKRDRHIAWAVRDGDVAGEVFLNTAPEGVRARASFGSPDAHHAEALRARIMSRPE